jgi:hypothetical protein
MFRKLLSLTPANLLFEFGTGRAMANARREREETAWTMAVVDAMAGRVAPAVTTTATITGQLEEFAA